jgi:hypothetical protein
MAEGGHLIFVWKPQGYELRERDGDPPAIGDTVELDEEGTFFVSRVGPSPRPQDSRPCAYLQSIK